MASEAPALLDSTEEYPSSRDAVISAANLLMVGLLKLNRVIVPSVLAVVSERKSKWIKRASADVAYEMRRTTVRKPLCVGSCCGGAYGTIVTTRLAVNGGHFDNVVKHAWLQSDNIDNSVSIASTATLSGHSTYSQAVQAARLQRQNRDHGLADLEEGVEAARRVQAVQMSVSESQDSVHLDEQGHLETLGFPGQIMHDDEIYYRLRVLEEERHRANTMLPAIYASVMTVYITMFSLIVYASIIITVTLMNFHFETWEAMVFGFTLVSTAIISEAETLLQVKTGANDPNLAPIADSKPLNPKVIKPPDDKDLNEDDNDAGDTPSADPITAEGGPSRASRRAPAEADTPTQEGSERPA